VLEIIPQIGIIVIRLRIRAAWKRRNGL